MFRVLLPADGQPRENLPRGSALLELGRGRAVACFLRGEPFAECCQLASQGQGRPLVLDFSTVEVGHYDEYANELRPAPRGVSLIEAWIGRRLHRGELVARDNQADRRARARQLMMQGRTVEAFRLDRRMGL